MRLSALLANYAGNPLESAELVHDLESAGLDAVWLPEAYGFDAISLAGFIASRTSRVEIGTAIVNVFSRSPALLAMTAAGVDQLSGGRFMLGVGASGPQVVEGLHGVPYRQPAQRIREVIRICRQLWAREEPLTHEGRVFTLPLPPDEGTGLGKPLKLINRPPRARIPIYWASLGDVSVRSTAAEADGWLPFLYMPEQAAEVFGPPLEKGMAQRDGDLGPLDVVAGGPAAVGEDLDVDALLEQGRPLIALYVGGMGARSRNFYFELMCRYGYEAEAERVREAFLDGRRKDAEALVPREWLERTSLIGSREVVADRLRTYAEAGVTTLSVIPVGTDVRGTVEQLRGLIDDLPEPAAQASVEAAPGHS
jgi:F420-dependent oxidoreductase-like protein